MGVGPEIENIQAEGAKAGGEVGGEASSEQGNSGTSKKTGKQVENKTRGKARATGVRLTVGADRNCQAFSIRSLTNRVPK